MQYTKILNILALLIVIYSCQKKPSVNSISEIPVDPESAQKATIENVFNEYKAVNITLPDSIFFGRIEQIRTDEERIYLFDPSQTKTITILDKKGNFINQLKNVGNGPGEYISPFAFAINESKHRLILYDRGKLEFLTYQLPSLKFIETHKVDAFMMNFEILDKDHFLVVRDGVRGNNQYYGLEVWNRNLKVIKNEISDSRSAVIELSYASSIGRAKNRLLYAHPFTGLISRITSSGLIPVLKLNFNRWEVPEELYEMDEARYFEEALARDTYALWPRFPLYFNNKLMVWYMYGADIDSYYLLIHDTTKNTQITYSDIMIGESLKLSMPLGIDGNRYISLVWPEKIESESIPNEYRELFERSLKSELPIILYLK